MKISKILTTIAAATTFASAAIAQDTQAYMKTFGMFMYKQDGFSELKLTPAEFDAFVSGMKASFEGKELPNQQELQKAMEYLNKRAEASMAERAKADQAKTAEFWKELEKKEGIQKTASGLAFEIIQKGSDKMAKQDSDVVVKYEGKLIDGTVFDSSEKHGGKPITFNLAQVIPGFTEGLQKIGKGGKIRLYIPSKLGYQNQSVLGIPPNSTLIFDVEMVDIDPPAAKK